MTDIFAAHFPAIPRFLTALCEWLACVIMLLPQPRRWSGKRLAGMLALCLLGQMVLQYFAGTYLSRATWQLWMLANLLFMVVTVGVCGRVELPGAVFWGTYAFILAEFMAAAIWQFCDMLFGSKTLLDPPGCLLSVSLLTLSVLVMLFLENRISFSIMEPGWKSAMEMVVFTVLIFEMSNIAFMQNAYQDSDLMGASFGWIRILVDLCGVCLPLLSFRNRKEQVMKQELEMMQALMNAQYQQYVAFRESNEYIARQCHDLKHQVEAIKLADSQAERDAYIASLEEAISQYGSFCNTGNVVVDTILTRERTVCMQNEVQFTYTVESADLRPLSTRDICIILGNLLDNAIEHAGKEKPEDRQILLRIFRENGFLVIWAENICRTFLELDNGLPGTTKSDPRFHGFGLKSVDNIVKKHDGIMQCQMKKEWFSVKCLFPVTE